MAADFSSENSPALLLKTSLIELLNMPLQEREMAAHIHIQIQTATIQGLPIYKAIHILGDIIEKTAEKNLQVPQQHLPLLVFEYVNRYVMAGGKPESFLKHDNGKTVKIPRHLLEDAIKKININNNNHPPAGRKR